jgi:glycosyltransferase involved in cell wall biosynthesis|tara:strand:- start:5989 stop:6789 length:801 start_codon:yes stop_codon:yes gene_type:complete
MNIKPTLAVVAISFNEEVDIPRFLEHLIEWVDEIVIVDSGSTDKTIEIINNSSFEIKLIETTLVKAGGYAALRNLGVETCNSDWVINMDIDERITERLKVEILSLINTNKHDAFRYRRLNYFLHRPMKAGGWNSWNNPQLARKGAHYYKGKLHEKCVVHGGEEKIGQLQSFMSHLNDESYLERMDKSFRYCQLESDKLIEKNVKVKGHQLLVHPILEFVKKYIYKKGFLDGIPGLIAAIHSADAVFRALALTWDVQNKIDRKKIDR